MRVLARVRSLLRGVLRRESVDADMADEFRFHVERRIEDLIAAGHAPRDASRLARREFGSVEHFREEGSAARGLRVVDEVRSDVRYAARTLLRNRGFASASILTLALGIGATAAILAVVDAVLLRPLPFPDAARLVTFARVAPGETPQGIAAARFAEYGAWREPGRALTHVGAYTALRVTVTGGQEPVRANALAVDAALLPTLGVSPLLGRAFSAASDRAGGPSGVLLTYGSWQDLFNGDRAVVGRTVELDGTAVEIAGVLPRDFDFPPATRGADGWSRRRSDILVPLGMVNAEEIAYYPFYMIGRLAPGATLEQARAELSAAAAAAAPAGAERSTYIAPLHEAVVGPLRPALYAFTAAVALVLLIACANLGSITLARLGAREQELSVRLTLGAGRRRVARQLVTESVVLSCVGGAAGLLLGWSVLRLLVLAAPAELPGIHEATLSPRVLVCALALAVAAGVIFGLIPALRLGRGDLSGISRVRGSTTAGAVKRAHSALIMMEVALAVLLLVGASLLIRSFGSLLAEKSGFRVEGLLTAEVVVPADRYPDRASVVRYFGDVEAALSSLSGIALVSAIDRPPFGPYDSRLSYSIAGAAAGASHTALNTAARPRYFETMGIALEQGRGFTDADDASAPAVVVVSRSLAARHWPGGGALGERITVFGAEREIVGVADDVRHFGPAVAPEPMIYLPQAQDAATRRMMTIVARARREPDALLPAVRERIRSVDAQVAISDLQSFGVMRDGKLAGERFNALLVGAFSALALLMAAVGIFGMLSFAVARRTREIGVRMAMGAGSGAVVAQIMRGTLLLITCGLAAGLVMAVPAAQALRGLLYGVEPLDAVSFGAAAVTLLCVGAVAAWLPARRAARVDPLVALRQE